MRGPVISVDMLSAFDKTPSSRWVFPDHFNSGQGKVPSMRLLALIVVVVFGASIVHAQSTPADAKAKLDEAKAKLMEKDQQRQAEREKMVSITAGELSDLRV